MKSISPKPAGFSLIEILISLAIFSVILVALSFSEFKSAKVIAQDYSQEKLLVLIHNNYETEYSR